LKMMESIIMERAHNYVTSIFNTPYWLEDLKLKAIEKGISLDSMVFLDALYMARMDMEIE